MKLVHTRTFGVEKVCKFKTAKILKEQQPKDEKK